MLDFRPSAHPDILYVYAATKGPTKIGTLLWHRGVGLFRPVAGYTSLSISQMCEITNRFDSWTKERSRQSMERICHKVNEALRLGE